MAYENLCTKYMTAVIRRVNYAKPIGTKTRTCVLLLLPENLSKHIVKLKESVPYVYEKDKLIFFDGVAHYPT